MKKDFSPEERLLRLIKGPKSNSPERQPEPKVRNITPQEKEKPRESVSFMDRINIGDRFKAISLPMPLQFNGFSFHTLNYIFVVILMGILVFFIYDLFYGAYYKPYEPKVHLIDDAAEMSDSIDKSLEIKPYNYYSSTVKGRNIFKPPYVEMEATVTGPTVDEVKASLSLIGIIAGDRPQAIIEDKKTGKSHFVYKDSSIGQSQIVDVLNDSVVIEYNGQRFELIL